MRSVVIAFLIVVSAGGCESIHKSDDLQNFRFNYFFNSTLLAYPTVYRRIQHQIHHAISAEPPPIFYPVPYMALCPTPLAWYSKILHMHTYSPFLKALSEKMLESGHILEPFGKSWWAIDLEESARDVESPPPLCADLARPLSISPAARQLCPTDIYQYERRFPSHARSPRRGVSAILPNHNSRIRN